jgi:2,3-dihydroxybenzoate-AMP ligase
VIVVGQAEEFVSFSGLEAPPSLGAQTSGPDVEPSSREVALLLVSGGTTGLPKLIPRTHDDYAYNVRASASVAGLNADSRYLVSLPIAHNFPLGCPGALGTLYAGGTVVFSLDPSPETAFAWIEREKITITALVPPLVLMWLTAAEWQGPNLRSLAWLQVGGARLRPETASRIRPVLGCRLQQVYGMAEGLLNFTRQDDPDEIVLSTQGRPLSADDEVRIVDADGADLPDGELGELLVRGPYTLRGYYRADDYNRRAFTPDGFYRSGDLVRRQRDGYLSVEGRVKDVINRGGDKVPVEEMESHLTAHPAIHDVAIIGVPHEVLGECTCACIVSRGTAPTLAELNAYLVRLGVASFKLPDRVFVVDRFPQTSVGKIDRRELARRVGELAGKGCHRGGF